MSVFLRWLKKYVRVALVIVFWLAVWQVASMIVNKTLLMPSPCDTFASLAGLVATREFWLSAALTFYRVALGLAVSFAAGVALAFFSSRSRLLASLLRPVVAAAKSTPVMSIIVLALVWFSASSVPVFACILLCFPIFYANTLAGIRSVNHEFLELAQVYNVKRKRVIADVIRPTVLPHVWSALSVCLGFSWKSVVAAEAISTPDYSMGYSMYATKLDLDTTGLFAWTVTIIVISLIVEKGVKRLIPAKGGPL